MCALYHGDPEAGRCPKGHLTIDGYCECEDERFVEEDEEPIRSMYRCSIHALWTTDGDCPECAREDVEVEVMFHRSLIQRMQAVGVALQIVREAERRLVGTRASSLVYQMGELLAREFGERCQSAVHFGAITEREVVAYAGWVLA